MTSTQPRTSRYPLPLVLAIVLVAVAGLSTKGEADSATDHIRVRIAKIYDLVAPPPGSSASAAPVRQAEARRLLDEIFDWDEMAKRALGSLWKERTAAEQTEFVRLFAELFRRTYLSRIEVADRQGFLYLDETVEGDSATVRATIVTKKTRQIPVHYLTRRAGDQWKVYDLTVGGTSLVSNYRAQFTALVARSSYQDLVEKLRALAGQQSGAAPTGAGVVLVGAGDIASCTSDGDEATATLLDAIDGVVFTLGDHAYETGTHIEFAACYEASWGRHRPRTRPSPGNHDYLTPGGSGYFDYFGPAAGDPSRGYYSYDLGSWHIIVLNSNCSDVGGCGPGSPQERWLRADLAAHPAACTLAYWHHPRFSSGEGANEADVTAFWQALYEHGAEIVLAGHDHVYERFAPQKPNGEPDPEGGVRQFVVGTGGAAHQRFAGPPAANSEARNDDTFGVLKLTLHPTSYEWHFIPVAGRTFTDSGRDRCR